MEVHAHVSIALHHTHGPAKRFKKQQSNNFPDLPKNLQSSPVIKVVVFGV